MNEELVTVSGFSKGNQLRQRISQHEMCLVQATAKKQQLNTNEGTSTTGQRDDDKHSHSKEWVELFFQ
jgi:hypothetical protein